MGEAIVRQLLSDKPIAYRPMLARALGGVTTGLWISQLLYWSDKGRDKEGWIYKTYDEWEQETAMSRSELDTARRNAKSLGIVEEKLAQVPAKLHYRIIWDRLEEVIDRYASSPSLRETCKQDCGKPANKIAGNLQPITESTAETTTYILPSDEPDAKDTISKEAHPVSLFSVGIAKAIAAEPHDKAPLSRKTPSDTNTLLAPDTNGTRDLFAKINYTRSAKGMRPQQRFANLEQKRKCLEAEARLGAGFAAAAERAMGNGIGDLKGLVNWLAVYDPNKKKPGYGERAGERLGMFKAE